MIEGERTINLEFAKLTVEFDRDSTIKLIKGGKLIAQLDPTELSTLYHAYCGMLKEYAELEASRSKQ